MRGTKFKLGIVILFELPLISVCIPAYNRSSLLPELLDSIVCQLNVEFEIVICEDKSPEREKIREISESYISAFPGQIFYYENIVNLGYDGNLRRLIELARGEYVLFMGNDDLLAKGALVAVSNIVRSKPNVGVVLRTYDSFENDPEKPLQIFRYFDREQLFLPGLQTVVTFFRRCVFISGMVVRRESALKYSTNRFDGTLLYQQHLVGQILSSENGVYIPQVMSHHRLGGIPDFGNSAAELGRFVPREQTPESSIHFMRGMLKIAYDLEQTLGLPVYMPILRDIGNYSFPILSIQAKRSLPVFIKYTFEIARLGLWKSPLFHLYFISLLVIGPKYSNLIINFIKNRLGYTPRFGIARKKNL